MCRGGGGKGGGDGGAAAREAERQARVDSGTRAINEMFGVQVAPPDPAWQTNKTARSAMYDTVKGDANAYFTKQLQESKDEAARQLSFQKARLGTAGSSQAIDLDSEFQKRYDRGVLDVSNRADSAASQMRSSDEQSRMSLLSKIASGMDQASAMSSAHAQMQSNAELGRQNAMSGQMGNVFADLFAARNAGAAADGQRQAQQEMKDQFGAFIANNKSYGGTVQNQ